VRSGFASSLLLLWCHLPAILAKTILAMPLCRFLHARNECFSNKAIPSSVRGRGVINEAWAGRVGFGRRGPHASRRSLLAARRTKKHCLVRVHCSASRPAEGKEAATAPRHEKQKKRSYWYIMLRKGGEPGPRLAAPPSLPSRIVRGGVGHLFKLLVRTAASLDLPPIKLKRAIKSRSMHAESVVDCILRLNT
jgi:hypothetical protein